MSVEQFAVSLISGLVGSLLGLVAALWTQARDRRHRQVGAGRALHIELVRNSTALHHAGEGRVWGSVTSAAWESQLPLVATMLDGEQLVVFARAHLLQPNCVELIETLKHSGPPLSDEERRQLHSAATDMLIASEALRPIVWRGHDPPSPPSDVTRHQ